MTVPKRSTLISALKRRSRARFKAEDDPNAILKALASEVRDATDRTIAIIYATMVEDALRHGLLTCMDHLTSDEEASFFEQSGPLSDFAAKINIAYAMKLMSKKSQLELHEIREIRNAFAHALPGLSFNDKEVSDLCRLLDFPKYWDANASKNWSPRALFVSTCNYYFSCFANWRPGCLPKLSINGSFL